MPGTAACPESLGCSTRLASEPQPSCWVPQLARWSWPSGGTRGSSSNNCLLRARLACSGKLLPKAASLLTSTLLCLPFPYKPYSQTPAVGYIWSSAHPPPHQILFSELCSCFGGRWTLLSSYFWLLKKKGFGVSKFQMNSVHPSAIQACQKTFKNLQECKPNLWWLRIRPLHPLE